MQSTRAHKITVVLADDHAVVRDGLRLILESSGDISVVGEAADGRAAVKAVQSLHPDIAVIDLSMPELNGAEAARQIRERSPGTRIVILSMHATSEHIYQALEAGALAYVLKDSAGKEVLEAVRAAFQGERFLSKRITETMLEDYVRRRQTAPEQSPLERLSAREREVLQLVVEGRTSVEIGEKIHLSPKTVDSYRSRLMHKLEIHDVASLVRFAITHGLSSPG
jgi:DNA-binding NarL/FixJ family response regulator